MRILQLHCDYVEYTPVKKEISLAEPLENTGTSRFEELVVAFVTLEKGDDDKTISNASPATSKAVMLNNTSPSVLFEYTFTLAFATVPFTSITYVEFKIVMFAF